MRLWILLLVILASGCTLLQTQPDQVKRPNQYEFHDYPVPEINRTKCISGKIRNVLAGPEALVLSVVSQDGTVANMRFPFTYLLTIQIPNDNTFCYDYVTVSG